MIQHNSAYKLFPKGIHLSRNERFLSHFVVMQTKANLMEFKSPLRCVTGSKCDKMRESETFATRDCHKIRRILL